MFKVDKWKQSFLNFLNLKFSGCVLQKWNIKDLDE